MDMHCYYISHNIIFNYEDKRIYIENDDEVVKINNKNFKEILGEYSWEELDYLWDIEIGNKYLMLDCGSNGDCLFHCISEAINLNNIYKNKIHQLDLMDIEKLRELSSREITKDNFDYILQNYKIEYEEDEFQGSWIPDNIQSINDLQNEIKKCGNNFWGDHIIIQLLSKKLGINFIILNNDIDDDNVSCTKVEMPNNKKIICLIFVNKCHYKLLGKFDGNKVNVIFKSIPKEILNINY
jgi:hypothetical protein